MIYIVSPFESKIEARGTRNIELSNLLVSNGHDVTFVTSNFSHQFKKNYSTKEMHDRLDDESYKTIILDVPPYFSNLSLKRMITHFSFSYQLYKFLKTNIKTNDIVISSSIPPELTLTIYILKKKKQFNVILDVRDIWPDAFPLKNNLIGKLFSFYCNSIYKLTLKKFDKIIYVAYSFDNWINKYTNNLEKVFIPLGFDLERWKNMNINQQNNEINLVYIGNISYQFDIRLIVDFVNNNENYKFHIVGDGDTFEEVKNISKTKRNIFYGRCSPEKVVEIINSKDIAILPIGEKSTAHMPNKLFDYLGAGLPILSLGNNDSSLFVKNNNIGWTASFDSSNIEKVITTISSENRIEKQNNIFKIREKYSKKSLYNSFLDVIDTLHRKGNK